MFKKGQSGNYKGRPKGETLGDIYRKDKKFPKKADKVFQRLLKSKDETIVFNTIKFMTEIRDGKTHNSVQIDSEANAIIVEFKK